MESLLDALAARAQRSNHEPLFRFLDEQGEPSSELEAAQLEIRSRRLARRLGQLVGAGDRVLLVLPTGPEFIVAFLACLAAGVVAVPVYPPGSRRGLGRLLAVARDAEPSLVLSSARQRARLQRLLDSAQAALPGPWADVESLESSAQEGPLLRRPRGEDIAFLQYTSGSTASPKGVIVTHANLVHNEQQIQAAFGQSERSIVVSWLPLYHDMGLIGGVLQPLFCGGSCVLLAPTSFLRRPALWLQAIDRYRATTSGSPNFGYELVADRVTDAEVAGLDLSCWEVAFNGAEPVRATTLDRFAGRFASLGFRRESFYPCYGLAEATLFVAGGRRGQPFQTCLCDREALAQGRVSPPSAGGAVQELVSCGTPWGSQTVAVVDPERRVRCAEGWVGEVWVQGASVAAGYWRKASDSELAATLAGEDAARGAWLRTGDLGFLAAGELYITGRRKDLIILRGRNLYPQDLELTAQASHPALSQGAAAAFGREEGGEERLWLACEVERGYDGQADHLQATIRQAIAEEHEVAVERVLLVRHGGIPRTSSGKVQRSLARQLAEADQLPLVRPSAADGAAGSAPPPAAGSELAQLAVAVAGVLRREPAELPSDLPLTALGLDSLRAVELQEAVQVGFGVELDLGLLLGGATLLELAQRLDPSRPGFVEAGSASAERVERAPAEGPLPLSPTQEALWLLERLRPQDAAYNLTFQLELRGPLDVRALAAALTALRRRHEPLRTRLVEGPEGSAPWQQVEAAGGGGASFASVDLEALPRTERESVARRLLGCLAGQPIDLGARPDHGFKLLRFETEHHAVVLAVHHLWADGWSLKVLVEDLGSLYTDALGGSTPAALDVRFADHAWAERQRRQSGELARLARGFLDELGEIPEALEAPTDRLRREEGPRWAGRSPCALAPSLWQAVQGRAAASATTPFAWLLAVWQAVLGTWAGSEHFWLAVPLANRQPPWTRLVGCFVHLGLLPADLRGGPTGAELVQRCARAVARSMRCQSVPFEELALALGERGSSGRSPSSRATVALQPAVSPALRGLTAALHEVPQPSAKLELALQLTPVGGGLEGALELDLALYDRTTGQRLVRRFERWLAAWVAEPERALAALSKLAPAEHHQLCHELQGPPLPVALQGVPRAVLSWCERAPEAVAVVEGESHWTYDELGERALAMAARLGGQGLEHEEVVGVALPRSALQIVATLGIWLARGVHLPLGLEQPAARLGELVRDAEARWVVTAPGILESQGLGGRRFELSVLGGEDADRPVPRTAERPLAELELDSLAYVLFTSGSTGRPKGVEVPHRGLASLVAWHLASYPIEPGRRTSQVAALGFDASIWEIWPTLAAGATLVVVPEDVRANPAALVGWLERHAVDTAFLPTPLAEAVLDVPWSLPASLRRLLTGGDRLRRSPGPEHPFVLYNHYGPTEASVVATAGSVGPETTGLPSIGRPIANLKAYVVDRGLRLAPFGGVGELALGGPALARGYRGRPGWTADRFRPDPFGSVGGRLYRTGDRARLCADGTVAFLGRADGQVKVRGVRIELGEVEAALARHSAVRTAVVAAESSMAGETLLSAYYLSADGAALDGAELRAFLRTQLPEAMVPSRFHQLTELPLSPNGKLDRRQLPRLADLEPVEGHPEGPVEEVLCSLWSEILGVPVAPEQSFFESGGHSLKLVELATAVTDTLGHAPALAEIVAAPTVRAMARALTADQQRGARVEATARLLVEVAGLTDEEAARRLATLQEPKP